MVKILQFILISLFLTISLWASRARAANVEFEQDGSLPIVYLNIVLDTGTGQDPVSKNGLAYIASHALLRGTQKHEKLAFFEAINALGGALDVDVRNEGIVYRAAVLSENLEKFLDLIEEALTKPKFTAGELLKLKKEVEGEILEQKGSDKALVQYHFYRFLYGSHPYGNPVLGTQKGAAAVTYKDVLDFYARNFGARTLHLFGTGAAKKSAIEKWFGSVSEKLGAIHPEARAAAMVTAPKIEPGRRALIVDKPKATQAQVLMGGTGMRPDTPGFYAIQLANHSFGGPSFQARMMTEIRVKRGWTYGAYNTFRFGREPKHFAMYVFPKTDDTPQAIGLMISMFEDFTKNGITRQEYEFARDSLVNNSPFNYDTPKKRLENATAEYLMAFPRGYYREFASNIEKIKYDDVKPALNGFFHPENLALTVVGDASKLREPLSRLPGFSIPKEKNYLAE